MSQRKIVFVPLAVLVLILLVSFSARAVHLSKLNASAIAEYNGKILPTTPDAYFFLSETRDLIEGKYHDAQPLRTAVRTGCPSLLVVISGALVKVFGFKLMDVALWLPVVFASLGMALLFTVYGFELDDWFLTLCAGCLTAIPYDWFIRTTLGYFDTDCLNVPLFYAVLFFLYKSSVSRRSKDELISLAAAGCCSLFLIFWWREAGHLLVAGLWGCWLLLPSRQRLIQYCKYGIACVVLLFFCAFLAGYRDLLPAFFVNIIVFVENYLRAANPDTSLFFDPFVTVSELESFGVVENFNRLCGHWSVFALSIPGACLFVKKYRLTGVVLIVPALIFFILSFFMGVRFLIFSAPFFGFSIAQLTWDFSFWICRDRRTLGYVLSLFLCVLFAFPAADKALTTNYDSMLNKYNANLATVTGEHTEENAKIWCWWGEGYFVQYFSRRWTVIDGGLQNPERSFLASFPLACTDYDLSASWIRFFAAHPYGLNIINGFTGDTTRSIRFFIDAFTRIDELPQVLGEYGIPEIRNWKEWLCPQGPVYLYLTPDLLLRNSWLTAGKMITNPEERISIFALPVNDLHADKQKGLVKYKDLTYEYSKAYFVTKQNLSHDFVRDKGPVMVAIKGSDDFFLINQTDFKALAFNLLFVHPDTTKHFTELAYHPFVGGIWKVE
ncbi:STT3 domain-containing protein [Desulfovibrio sp. JC022]|uniref:STT3 domain-containing protein n=1 Tax=Desulfovibrio sp. JC022 TaxID=2593642 RepID=UPI0013D1DC25|nr:STT3 domain-containing protein [Desulfovibrio sp. JC022]NDV24925.1 hypothetical protein [Desulfovibrio sp. JC022]